MNKKELSQGIKLTISNHPFYNDFPEELKKLFNKIFSKFAAELAINRNFWFDYNGGDEDVFNQNECTYTGMLNNSIVKAIFCAATLLEAAVYEDGKSIGRIDCLARIKLDNNYINLVIESKQWPNDGKVYSNLETKQLYEKMIKQATKYYSAERSYYRHESYVVAIIFEYLKDKVMLNKMIEDKSDDGITNFFIVYYEEGRTGMMVYGRIEKVI